MFIQCSLDDLSELISVGRKAYYDTFARMNTEETMKTYLDEAFSIEKLTDELNNPDSCFFFYKQGDETAGYLKLNYKDAQSDIFDPESLEIERIYVLKTFKRRGIGRKMIEFSVREAQAKKLQYIWLGVWEKNTEAIEFYKKSGFVPWKTHQFRMGDELQDDLIMKRTLQTAQFQE